MTLAIVVGVVSLLLLVWLGFFAWKRRRASGLQDQSEALEGLVGALDPIVPPAVTSYAIRVTASEGALHDAKGFVRVVRRILDLYEEHRTYQEADGRISDNTQELASLRQRIDRLEQDVGERITKSQMVVGVLTTVGALAGLAGLTISIIRLAAEI